MSIWIWTGFLAFVATMVMLDLGVFHRRPRAVSISEALAWTMGWVLLALFFNVGVYFLYETNWTGGGVIETGHLNGNQAAIQFFTGYLLEKSLSVDNVFVIAVIFAHFRVPLDRQHRVLFWGVLGAVALRGAMIAIGAGLLERFFWIAYVFGGLLFVTAAKLLLMRHDNIDPNRNVAVRFMKRRYPVASQFDGDRFFTRLGAGRVATPLLLSLALVESSGLLIAVDSIPAIFAVTQDPFLVFTSNVFAVLGLRAMYFALAGLMYKLRYLKISLAFVLAYAGLKISVSQHFPIPNLVSLTLIGSMIGVGIAASFFSVHDTRLVSPLMDNLEGLAAASYRQARRIVVLVVGLTVVLIGMAMLALPGPGLVTIVLGLAILAVEFTWARRWLKRFKEATQDARKGVWRWFSHKEKKGKDDS